MVLEARNLDGSIPTLPTEANFAGSTGKYLPPSLSIEDCAKDGGEEFFTKMHCVRIANL